MRQARFISIEGIDGAGKSTQTGRLLAHLAKCGADVLHTREPGGTPLAEKIRAMLLSDDMAPDAETLLFFAARADHVRRVIRPALEAGRWVVSDRFTDATYAYQVGGKGFPADKARELERWTLGDFAPDLTILFDVPPAVAAERLRARAGGRDRFETMGEAFFERVRAAYLDRAAADPGRFLIVDATGTPEAVTEVILQKVSQWL